VLLLWWWWCQRPNSDVPNSDVPRPLQHAEAIAAELLCLAASSDAGRALLAPVVESGTLYSLLNSRFVTCRHVTSSYITCETVVPPVLSAARCATLAPNSRVVPLRHITSHCVALPLVPCHPRRARLAPLNTRRATASRARRRRRPSRSSGSRPRHVCVCVGEDRVAGARKEDRSRMTESILPSGPFSVNTCASWSFTTTAVPSFR